VPWFFLKSHLHQKQNSYFIYISLRTLSIFDKQDERPSINYYPVIIGYKGTNYE